MGGHCWIAHQKPCVVEHIPDMCRPGTRCTRFPIHDEYGALLGVKVHRMQGFCAKPGEGDSGFINHFQHAPAWPELVHHKMPDGWKPTVEELALAVEAH